MRWMILFILFIPLAYSAGDGWYYAGDTWEDDGILYSVEGSYYDTVLLGVDGQLHLIQIYNCKTVGFAEYCFTDTGYPADEDHIKYEAGERLYGYYLTFDTFEPDIDVSREVSDSSVGLGDEIEVEVSIRNEGDYTVNDIYYTEIVPEGVEILQGPRVGSTITFTQNALPVAQNTKFVYRLRPVEFGTFELTPNFTYSFDGQIMVGESKDWKITVESPIEVTSEITNSFDQDETLAIDEKATYTIRLENIEDEQLDVEVSVTVPEDVDISSTGDFSEREDDLHREINLHDGQTQELSFEFYPGEGGKISAEVTYSTGSERIDETYSETISVDNDLLEPEIRLFPNTGTYFAGSELNITGILDNTNLKVRFHNIEGRLESDLFPTIRFNHESQSPDNELTEAQRTIVLPYVESSEKHKITLSGTFESPRGTEYTFSESRDITIKPFSRAIEVTHKVTPSEPVKGGNVSVTVNGKNTLGSYVTINAHEEIPTGLINLGGLRFVETSLEKDTDDKLYEYKLGIPEDYPQDSIVVTTVVLVEGERLTEETKTEIFLKDAPRPVEDAGLIEAEVTNVTMEELEDEESSNWGFFRAIWDFVKRLFD